MADKATGASSSMHGRLKRTPSRACRIKLQLPQLQRRLVWRNKRRSIRPSQRNLATRRRVRALKPSSETFWWCTPTSEEAALNKSLVDVETKLWQPDTGKRKPTKSGRPKWQTRSKGAAWSMSRRLKKNNVSSTSNQDRTGTHADAKNTSEKTKD
jgi:hypothetical protein